MAASGERAPRRGPAPIASFDHDVSDESSPETKQTVRLPEIRELSSGALVPPSTGRARSHSSPGPSLCAAAPRIDISRASSSSHHDSRDSSPELPELALLAGGTERDDHLGFREDGALDLRSSTEELAFLEQPAPAPPPPPPPAARRHSRKDSQGSETALLAISGRTSRLSSVGSQCSAHSALSALSHAAGRVSRLSAASGADRSPSPHKMLLETSFCGPKPIETDPDMCAAAVEERLLEIAKLQAFPMPMPMPAPVSAPPASAPSQAPAPYPMPMPTPMSMPMPTPMSMPMPTTMSMPMPTPMPMQTDARDRREVRTEVTVEAAPVPRAPRPARRPRSRERRDVDRPEVYKQRNRSKDVIRIKLKPDDEYEDDEDEDDEGEVIAPTSKPETLTLRSPSPAPAAPPSRKSSFCSLFKSRETIASPDSPSDALRRKKSLTEGRSRSKSRERASSAAGVKLRGSVLSLFRTPRRSVAASPPSPPPTAAATQLTPAVAAAPPRGLKYYDEGRDGIIHIPLRTPPDETPRTETTRPASAPCRATPSAPSPLPAPVSPPAPTAPHPPAPTAPQPPVPPARRTVLPDGSIIIPLHSPTEREPPISPPAQAPTQVSPKVKPEARAAVQEAVTVAQEAVTAGAAAEGTSAIEASGMGESRARRKERLMFSTHVGSAEQVFCTQFSITKTPSVTSEISESFPSLPEEARVVLRETHVTTDGSPPDLPRDPHDPPDNRMARHTPHQTPSDVESEGAVRGAVTPEVEGGEGLEVGETGARDSSESDGSSDAARGSDAEQRGLVVQESFEELPYVPTTLPQERSLALPMLPVRERSLQLQTTARVQRPRAARGGAGVAVAGALVTPPAPAPLPPPAASRLTIRLPRRSAAPTSTAPSTTAAPTASTTTATIATTAGAVRDVSNQGWGESRRSSSTSEAGGATAAGTQWIDFSEVPERRTAARRITTVAAQFVAPEHCACRCHRDPDPDPDPDPDLDLR